jgi:phenylpropionate dioxygenase-like ring-hydroxylating dioxygenase large terminal subunit
MDAAEAEALIVKTGPVTPAGEQLRCYWHPIALVEDLTEAEPVKPVRVLSESLVLFRAKDGQVGLIQERCPHSGYPLAWAHVDENSLACGRHAWHFDVEGKCFLVGYESKVYPLAWAQAKTYPVVGYGGVYWAYLGPLPTPAPPSDDLLTSEDPPEVGDTQP